jgi:hypothetical protein
MHLGEISLPHLQQPFPSLQQSAQLEATTATAGPVRHNRTEEGPGSSATTLSTEHKSKVIQSRRQVLFRVTIVVQQIMPELIDVLSEEEKIVTITEIFIKLMNHSGY